MTISRKPSAVGLCLLYQCIQQLLLLCVAEDATRNGSWTEFTSWLTEHGAFVHSGLSLNASCESTGMRGVISTTPVAANTQLFRIPTKLMILEDVSAAKSVTDEQVKDLLEDEQIRLALALARKIKKGKRSAYFTYISMLPEPKDFQDFHPIFAGQSMRADFGELPVLGLLERSRTISTRESKNAFQIWKTLENSKAAFLSWGDVEAALHLVRTRSVRTPGKGLAMVPLYDLVNTAEDSKVNVAMTIDQGVLKVRTTRDLPSNTEILASYSSACDNEIMLHTYGTYFASNPILPSSVTPVRCLATCDKAERPHATSNSLWEAAEAIIDLTRAKDALAAGWNSPPCKETMASSSQGRLRCSLARLAWETCAAAWGFATRQVQPAAFTGPSLEHHASAHLEIGNSLAKNGDQQAAIDQWESVLKLQPLNFTANIMLGISKQSKRDFGAAKGHYYNILRTNPRDSQVHVLLGKVMVQEGNMKSGANEFRLALEADPDNAEAKVLLQRLQSFTKVNSMKNAS